MTMDTLLYADFQNVDPEGRIRLTAVGTLEGLARLRLSLSERLPVMLDTDDGDSDRGLTVPGIAEFSSQERIWVAVVDWSQLVRNSSASGARRTLPDTRMAESPASSFA